MTGEIIDSTYTRSGNFYLDATGAIVNADGKCLVGAQIIDMTVCYRWGTCT